MLTVCRTLLLFYRKTYFLRKDAVYIINTARAGSVDEPAVLAALNGGQIGGLTTDVFDQEPPRDTELARHPKVIATPRIGGFTRESITRAVDVAVENLLIELRKEPVRRSL